MFDLKTVMKIMSKSLSQHFVRSQGKMNVTRKEKKNRICKFLLYFSVLQCTSHRLISVGDLG